MYVTNFQSNTISVIDILNNTVIDTISVGENPFFIERITVYGERGEFRDNLYVTNTLSNTISVIDILNNNNVTDTILVGQSPSFIETVTVRDEAGEFRDYLYVANFQSNTTSVINPTTNTVIDTISVGENPSFIRTLGDALYVANSGSNTLSLVDPLTNEEVAGMKFDIKPFGAGQIICDGLDVPIDRFLYVSSGAKCVAKSTTGFEFSSWTQNLPRNTNVTISASTTSDWLVIR